MGLEGVVNTFFKGKDLESGDADRILQYRAECIKAALAPSFTGIGINYGENFERVINRYKFKKTVREQLRKRRVIELGPGDDPKAKLLFERYDIGEERNFTPVLKDPKDLISTLDLTNLGKGIVLIDRVNI